MLWRDTVGLISLVPGQNEYGDPVMVEGPPRMVYANRRSIRQSEFYQAAQAGLRPEIMFEVRSAEYQGETKLRYEGTDYLVIRTYDKGEIMELVCSGLVGAMADAGSS